MRKWQMQWWDVSKVKAKIANKMLGNRERTKRQNGPCSGLPDLAWMEKSIPKPNGIHPSTDHRPPTTDRLPRPACLPACLHNAYILIKSTRVITVKLNKIRYKLIEIFYIINWDILRYKKFTTWCRLVRIESSSIRIYRILHSGWCTSKGGSVELGMLR